MEAFDDANMQLKMFHLKWSLSEMSLRYKDVVFFTAKRERFEWNTEHSSMRRTWGFQNKSGGA